MLKILFPIVVLLFIASHTAFSFPNEPDGYNGIKWGSPLGKEKSKVEVSHREGSKTMSVRRSIAPMRSLPGLASESGEKYPTLLVYVNKEFFGMQMVIGGRKAFERVTRGFIDRFGDPVSADTDDVVDGKNARVWAGDETILIVEFDQSSNKTAVSMMSKKMMDRNPEFITETEAHEDKGNADASIEAPMCFDIPKKTECKR